MIDPNDMTHPRNHTCDRCGAKPGEYCRSRNGNIIIGYAELHVSRHNKAWDARKAAR